MLDVIPDCIACLGGKKDLTHLLALSPYPDCILPYVLDLQVTGLAKPHAGKKGTIIKEAD